MTTPPNDFPVSRRLFDVRVHRRDVQAVEASCGVDVSAALLQSVKSLFFHRPFHPDAVRAMSFLYVRGLARGDHTTTSSRSCATKPRCPRRGIREATSSPICSLTC